MRLLSAPDATGQGAADGVEQRGGQFGRFRSQLVKERQQLVTLRRMLSLLARTSAERGPWSKSAISPKRSPGPERGQNGFLAANHQTHAQFALQHQKHAVIGLALFDNLAPLAHVLRIHGNERTVAIGCRSYPQEL